jgi:hypothetical protein
MSSPNNKPTTAAAPMSKALRTLFRSLQRPYFQNNSHLRKAVESLRGSKKNNTSTGKRVTLPTKEENATQGNE